MAIHPVESQYGTTLIEVLVTVFLSSLMILSLSGLIVSQLKYTDRLNRRIYLQRQLAAVALQIRKDLRRAGFNMNMGQSAAFRQQKQMLAVSVQANQLGYLYRVALSGQQQFRQVVYRISASDGSPRLLLCEKYSPAPLTVAQAAQSDHQSPCFSVFDSKRVQVDEFLVSATPASPPGSAPESATDRESSCRQIAVLVRVSLINLPSVHESVWFSVAERNHPV